MFGQRSGLGLIAALLVLSACQTTSETRKLAMSGDAWAALSHCQENEKPCFLAVSTDGQTAVRSEGFDNDPDKEQLSVVTQCEKKSGQKCFVLVNGTWDEGDSVSAVLGLLSDKEVRSGEWQMCLTGYNPSHNASLPPYFPIYVTRGKCRGQDYNGVPINQRMVRLNTLKGMYRDSSWRKNANVSRPTLRDRPDRDLCQTLAYQNPDHIKEAKRRGLTDAKCREILGN